MTVLHLFRGDSDLFSVTAVDGAGAPLDLTAKEIRSTAKRSQLDPDADAVWAKSVGNGITVTDALGGLCTITIDPADTAELDPTTLHCDVQVQSGTDIRTLMTYKVVVTYDITRTFTP